MTLERWLTSVWYSERSGWWLMPLGWLLQALVALRVLLYASGLLRQCRLSVPVVVVGNITVGGTGKTPLVLWVTSRLRALGAKPGIVCRGYRGKSGDWPLLVTGATGAGLAGDEAVMLARRSGVPVAAGPDRCAAGRLLVEQGADIVVSDDGLQHYGLQRDLEIAVVDGERLLGNGRFIPAGPLRESAARLAKVDFVVVNGNSAPDTLGGALAMQVDGDRAVSLAERVERPLAEFTRVHAVAGIGNPARFFGLLRRHGIEVIEHPLADHVSLTPGHFDFEDTLPILMTEKDAVKAAALADARMWAVPVTAQFAPAASVPLETALESLYKAVSA